MSTPLQKNWLYWARLRWRSARKRAAYGYESTFRLAAGMHSRGNFA
jgi:hypothetical protein